MSDNLMNRGWEQMEELLDQHMPVKRNRRLLPFYWLAGAGVILALIASLTLIDFNRKDNAPKQIAQVQTQNDSNHSTSSINDSEQGQIKSDHQIASASKNSNNSKTSNEIKTSGQHDLIEPEKINASASVQTSSSIHSRSPEESSKTPVISSHNATQTVAGSAKTEDPKRERKSTDHTVQSQKTAAVVSSDREPMTSETKGVTVSTPVDPVGRTSIKTIPELELHIQASNNLNDIVVIYSNSIKYNAYNEAMIQGLFGDNISSYQIGLNRYFPVSKRLHFSAGMAYAYQDYESEKLSSGADQPTTDIFTDSRTFSAYLGDNQIESSNFLAASSTLFFPLTVHYNFNSRFSIHGGLIPGVQVHQAITYSPIHASGLDRNPNIGNDGLTAEDFFKTKPIAVVDVQAGVSYRVFNRCYLHLDYRKSLSDYGRGIQYAGAERLEQISAGTIDRNYYSIEQKAIRPEFFGLGMSFRF